MTHLPNAAADVPLEVMPTSNRRLVGIEGLRAAAALSVMFGHFNLHLVPGNMVPPLLSHVLNVAGQGLTLFFVLSGFLLFGPFMNAAAQARPFGVPQYLLNRFLRIYPAYFVIFVIAALGLGLAYTKAVSATDADVGTIAGTVGRMTSAGGILANLLLVHTLTPWTIKTGLGVSWSLTAEICFYLLLPILATIAVRCARRYGLTGSGFFVSFCMIALGLICRTAGEAQVSGDAATQFFQEWGGNWLAVFLRSILCQADLFGAGMLALVFFRYSATITGPAKATFRRCLFGAALFGLALTRIEHEFGYAVFFAALILIVTTETSAARPSALSSFLEWYPLRWLGVISYSFYLWHLPVIWGLYKWQLHEQRPDNWASVALTYLLVVVITTGLASATYIAVERPALLLKSRPNAPRRDANRAVPVK
ncbi:MAG: acyltransferase [Pseudolabrys sp.]|jgi:peptidoglycan/LPS O-acetylase OafA/YrhL